MVAKTRHLSYRALELLQQCDLAVAMVKKGIGLRLKKSTPKRVFFTHAQSSNGRIDSYQTLHIESLAGCSNIFQTASKFVQGFGRGGLQIFAFPIDFSIGF